MAILSDGILELTKSVPKVDGLVARTGDNLTVVSGEGDGQNILGVTDETTSGFTGLDFPETEGTIPRTRKSKSTIRREGNILDEVGVSSESSLGDSILGIRATKLPHNHGAIAGSGDNSVRSLKGGSNGGNPATMTDEFTTENKLVVRVH